MDTDKDNKEPYRPNFMQHFDRKSAEDNRKDDNRKRPGKKTTPTGPQSVYTYFPCIPEGMDFREYVSSQHVRMSYCRQRIFRG